MNPNEDQPTPSLQSPPATPATPAPTPPGTMSKDEQTMGMLCHLTGLAGFLIPFGHLVGPLVIWMLKRQEMPFVESEGKESLNFQITMTICGIVAAISLILIIGFILLPAVLIFNLVFVIIATMESANGKPYRYPFCIRFIK